MPNAGHASAPPSASLSASASPIRHGDDFIHCREAQAAIDCWYQTEGDQQQMQHQAMSDAIGMSESNQHHSLANDSASLSLHNLPPVQSLINLLQDPSLQFTSQSASHMPHIDLNDANQQMQHFPGMGLTQMPSSADLTSLSMLHSQNSPYKPFLSSSNYQPIDQQHQQQHNQHLQPHLHSHDIFPGETQTMNQYIAQKQQHLADGTNSINDQTFLTQTPKVHTPNGSIANGLGIAISPLPLHTHDKLHANSSAHDASQSAKDLQITPEANGMYSLESELQQMARYHASNPHPHTQGNNIFSFTKPSNHANQQSDQPGKNGNLTPTPKPNGILPVYARYLTGQQNPEYLTANLSDPKTLQDSVYMTTQQYRNMPQSANSTLFGVQSDQPSVDHNMQQQQQQPMIDIEAQSSKWAQSIELLQQQQLYEQQQQLLAQMAAFSEANAQAAAAAAEHELHNDSQPQAHTMFTSFPEESDSTCDDRAGGSSGEASKELQPQPHSQDAFAKPAASKKCGQKRAKRRMTDKQRRAKIKTGLGQLAELVAAHAHGSTSTSHATVVESSVTLVHQLLNETHELRSEYDRLLKENTQMDINYASLKHQRKHMMHHQQQSVHDKQQQQLADQHEAIQAQAHAAQEQHQDLLRQLTLAQSLHEQQQQQQQQQAVAQLQSIVNASVADLQTPFFDAAMQLSPADTTQDQSIVNIDTPSHVNHPVADASGDSNQISPPEILQQPHGQMRNVSCVGSSGSMLSSSSHARSLSNSNSSRPIATSLSHSNSNSNLANPSVSASGEAAAQMEGLQLVGSADATSMQTAATDSFAPPANNALTSFSAPVVDSSAESNPIASLLASDPSLAESLDQIVLSNYFLQTLELLNQLQSQTQQRQQM